jgi:O-antigen/teichoic acid export membrane protein
MKKIIAANTVSQLVGKAISAVATFTVTFIIARQLGASGYGDFVKITTYIAFFYLLADFGINALYLQQSTSRTSWPALIVIRTIGGLLLLPVAVGIASLLPGVGTQGYTAAVRWGILLYSPTIVLQAWITTSNAIFQKQLRYDLATWAIFFGSLITVIFIFFHTSALFALGVGTAVTAIIAMCFALRSHPVSSWHISFRDMKNLLIPSLPLGITLIFNLVYFRADSVIITLTRPTAEVGIYGLAYKIFEVILVFPTFFMNAVYPLMLQQRMPLKKMFTNSFLFLLGAGLASTVCLWFAAPLVSLVKIDFAPSVTALRVLSLGLPFFFVTSTTMWALIALKKQKVLAGIYGVSMLVNIIGNILLVPSHGYMAAAWLTVACEGFVLVLSSVVLLQSL